MVKKVEHHTLSDCPIACGLDIIGDHWTLLIIRAMMFFGMHEYKDFLTMPENIASNILSDRLKKLEENAIIASIEHPDSKRRKLYYLTDRGKDMFDILIEIGRWSNKHLGDVVSIPQGFKNMSAKKQALIKEETLQNLNKWEKMHLGKTGT